MMSFAPRVFGAALLDTRVYEEVESDPAANAQAVAIVLIVSVATAIGLPGVDAFSAGGLLTAIVGSVVGWVAWAALTYTIGTRLLPEPQTQADVGQLLRTLAFASSPGLLRVFGAIPVLAVPLYTITALWMLAATIVAVRQALDYASTARAVGVCAVGWALSIVILGVIGFFGPGVS